MSFIDWLVMGAYLAAMLAVAGVVGRGQNSRKDYYLGGNEMGALPLATSTIATQCSTNSLLGAPAFVGFAAGGGGAAGTPRRVASRSGRGGPR